MTWQSWPKTKIPTLSLIQLEVVQAKSNLFSNHFCSTPWPAPWRWNGMQQGTKFEHSSQDNWCKLGETSKKIHSKLGNKHETSSHAFSAAVEKIQTKKVKCELTITNLEKNACYCKGLLKRNYLNWAGINTQDEDDNFFSSEEEIFSQKSTFSMKSLWVCGLVLWAGEAVSNIRAYSLPKLTGHASPP